MAKIRALLSILLVAGFSSSVMAQTPAPATPRLDTIKLPPGFSIELYAGDVTNARSMVLSPNGTLFVGTRRIGVGNVYAIVDRNKDNKADEVILIAKGLNMPNGVAFRNGSLYVADTTRLLRYDNIEAQLKNPPAPVVLYENFPNLRLHQWHFIAFGPDGMLYVPIGSPCTDYCDPTVSEYKNSQDEVIPADKRFASIMRMKPDGTEQEIFASGIRNTVGFDWHPVTRELWFTDNGRDGMGGEIPPDELNRAPRGGLHFGYPYCEGGTIQDPPAPDKPCSRFEPPAQHLGPHVAAIGMRFYAGSMFPAEYKNQVIIVEHGSIPFQRRDLPRIGYRLMLVRLDASGKKAVKYEPFAEGWLQGDTVWGRPADVLVMPDGSLLVSDDQANAIYRITYKK